ncbi:MAG TPA: hypothetical protein VK944_08850 [Candidatus Limnocylindria bacterium]|nr:hypothetical protein [Candidatus Limnocylindria bacterium]
MTGLRGVNMAMLSERSTQVYNAFDRYARTHDRLLIGSFSREEIEIALAKCSRDRGSLTYVVMEQRREELSEEERLLRRSRDKWLDKTIYYILGVIPLMIGFYLTKWIVGP